MKNEKNSLGFLIQKYGKFWNVLLEHFIKHKPLISEECSSMYFSSEYWQYILHTKSIKSHTLTFTKIVYETIANNADIFSYFAPHILKNIAPLCKWGIYFFPHVLKNIASLCKWRRVCKVLLLARQCDRFCTQQSFNYLSNKCQTTLPTLELFSSLDNKSFLILLIL